MGEGRNRFKDNIKVHDPALKADNWGKHSPDFQYNTLVGHDKLYKPSMRRD